MRAGRGEHDVVGGEVLAVVEFDALAQMEAPARRLDHFPALGEAGNDLQVLVALGEALVDVAEHAVGEGLVERIGIERLQVALEREPERRGDVAVSHAAANAAASSSVFNFI